MTRRFTGRHMAAVMILFFTVVIGVNIVMASFAIRSFGGTVVDNGYVASQKFNGWLAEADAQRQLGWRTNMLRDGGVVRITITRAEMPVSHARISGIALHPLGRLPDVHLGFRETAPGVYQNVAPLAPGRWRLRLTVDHGGESMRFLEEVAA